MSISSHIFYLTLILWLGTCNSFLKTHHHAYGFKQNGHSLRMFATETEPPTTVYQKLEEKLRGANLYLIGMMGSGKSTVGALLAGKLSYKYLDTDEISEYMIEMPISEFFATEENGESIFRNLENRILTEISQYANVIVSTGGGIVIKPENWGLLRHGVVVYLQCTPELLYGRLTKNKNDAELAKRPLLQGSNPLERLQTIYEERKEKYNQADVSINIDQAQQGRDPLTAEEVAQLVASEIVSFIEKNPPLWETWKKERALKTKEGKEGKEKETEDD